jgi:hypothetical protein
MKRILIGTIAVDTGGIVIADPSHLADFDSHTENLDDLLPPGCSDLNHMLAHPAPQLPFSREACWVAISSHDRGGILGTQHGSGDERVGPAVAAATEGDGFFPVYLELRPNAERDQAGEDLPVFDIARIVIDLGDADAEPQSTGPEEIVRCVYTDEDIRVIAAAAGVPIDVALERARRSGKHIANTVSGLVADELKSAITTDEA